MHLIDCRCPRCNRPITARPNDDVVWVTPTEAKVYASLTVCPNPDCKTGVTLVPTTKAQGALTQHQYHYTTK